MRQSERARLARREKYREQQVIFGYTPDGKSVTRAQAQEFDREDNVALHEACHAVAAWMLGVPIEAMYFNDGANARFAPLPETAHLAAVTVVGISIDEMIAAPIGERLVHARQHAFVTLAGVFGSSGNAWSSNPAYEFETHSHMTSAAQALVTIGAMSIEDANAEVDRLAFHVTRTFNDKRVETVTWRLSEQFLRQRDLPGEKVAAIVSQAWRSPDRANCG